MSAPIQASATRPASPRISVIVPVYNGAAMLQRCLDALASSRGVEWECIVVDDGSTDASAGVARESGARVIHAGDQPGGPARARNLGASAATASLVCFVDADVCVRPDTLAEFVRLFDEAPHVSAAFGSYDDRPGELDFFSQYRNLLHHFVHQRGSERASTFWSGCGVIRTDVFLANGGFDADQYPRPCIEDIELGVRLSADGHSIRLARHIQVTHLKRWTLRSIISTDVLDRAVPWTRLIMRTRKLPNDLNLGLGHRLSAVCVYVLAALLGLGCLWPLAWLLIPVPAVVLLIANRELYALFVRRGGMWFATRALAMHWLYFVYSSAAFAYGSLTPRSTPQNRSELRPSRALMGWVVAAITLGALGVRLTGLESRPVWTDEAMSAYWASYPLSDIPRLLLENEGHPPLFYVLTHFWLPLATNDVLLRLPDAVFGALAVAVTFSIGRNLAGPRVGVVAAAMLAIQPLAVWQSQEARPYALLMLLVALALWLVTRPGGLGSRWAVIGYALVTTAALYTHYGAALLIAALAGAALLARSGRPEGRRALVGWVAANGLALALFTPWLLALGTVLLRDSAAYTDGYIASAPDVRMLARMPLDLLVPYARELPGPVRWGAFGLLVAVIGSGAWRMPTSSRVLVLAWLAGSVGLVWLLAQRYPVFFQPKVLLPLMPALVILLACGLARLWDIRRGAGLLAASLVGLVFVPQLIQVYLPQPVGALGTPLGPWTEDWRSVAGYVAERAKPGDALLFLPAGLELSFVRAYPGIQHPMHGLPVDAIGQELPLGVGVQSGDLPHLPDQASPDDFWVITLVPPVPQMGIELALGYYDAHAILRERVQVGNVLLNHYAPD